MDDDGARARLELHEPGFDGELVIEEGRDGRHVRVSGIRPQDGAAVVKDLPADRDPELAELVELVVGGDDAAAVRLLAHVGVLDPA
ncbi:hypothetical protein A7K94_0200040 [Modestobacter sp. VKM Ac-2676]|nr:hypothetical protein A7K94_0200040 [Modestobacter sp. VKM Ac-2676]